MDKVRLGALGCAGTAIRGKAWRMVSRCRVAAGAAFLLMAVEARAAETPLAEVIATEPADAGIAVTVPTGGCTKKADFQTASQPAGEGAAKIEIRRLKSDWCKGNFPDGIKFVFTWDELKVPAGTKLTLANPVKSQAVQPREVRKASVSAPRKFKKRCKRTARGKRWCKAHRRKRHSHRVTAHAGHHHYAHHVRGAHRVHRAHKVGRHYRRRHSHCPFG
jgi:hypothetical protein